MPPCRETISLSVDNFFDVEETMRESEIVDYAKRLLDAHGKDAEREAAQKAREYSERNDPEQAETWRKIRSAIGELRNSSL
jgi:hypothetical protein